MLKREIKKSFAFFSSVLAIAISIVLFTTGCESEVDLGASYKSTPVIVGILDYTVDTQFVRINRTYLGPGNNEAYAQIKDSVEYRPEEVEAWLIKKRNGEIQDSIKLEYITKPSRESGAFYNQDVGFYYTDKPLFTPENIEEIELGAFLNNIVHYEYTLVVEARGELFTATTDFPSLSEATISRPRLPQLSNPPTRLEFYLESTKNFKTENFFYSTSSNSYRYLGIYRLNFDYVLENGTKVENQFIDYKLGTHDNPEGKRDQKNSFSVNGRNWFEYVGAKLKEIPNLKQVQIKNTEFRLTGSNETLTRYLKAANPVSDFTPTLSTYSNIDNGAIGILGSRTVLTRVAHLSEPSIKQLNESVLTAQPGVSFCVIDWAGSNYVCSP